MRLSGCFLSLVVLGLTGCQKRTAVTEQPSASLIEACTLVATDELASIQGALVTGSNSSEIPDHGFITSQCYYGSAAPDKSVSISLTQVDPKQVARHTPRDLWREKFAATEDEDADEKREESKRAREEEEEHKAAATKIDGIGEEAFWAANQFGGVLYVLEKDRILRISVGGPDDREVKLERSKAIAQKALSRL